MNIYDQAISSGASCGKLLGAGGGGFFAFFVPPDQKLSFKKKEKTFHLDQKEVTSRLKLLWLN